MTMVFSLIFMVIFFSESVFGFYIPGVAPQYFDRGDFVEVKAVKMTSTKTQLPYDYYNIPVHCKPVVGTKYKSENLGEILRGDRIVNTNFNIQMDTNIPCRVLCQNVTLDKEQSVTLSKRIQNDYHVHLLIDNLPCATKYQHVQTKEVLYEHGYRLGMYLRPNNEFYLNNHLIFKLHYHKEAESDLYQVVGFDIEPKSVDSNRIEIKANGLCTIAGGSQKQKIDPHLPTHPTIMTYEVQWFASTTPWASRWDTYLNMSDVDIHWFSILNSVIVLFFLTGILSMIIIKTIRRDIARYNDENVDETAEETGWKLVHGDVFRPPRHKHLLTAFVGSGIQIFLMASIVIIFGAIGMLSPSSRGSLVTVSCFLYVFMGLIAGFFSGRIYKTIKGSQWKRTASLTATLYPSIVFGIFLFLNFFIWGKRSSGAVPFPTMLTILLMWFGISFPLVCLGFYFGYRKQPYDQPVRTNQIPRQISEQQWYLHPVFSTLLAGILPFGAMFIELFFIFSAIWENQYYYLFGFLFLVFIIIIITCSQISIVITYFQLCAEDYHWWWRSFIVSGGSAFYIFVYSIFYFFSKLEITEIIPSMLYFGYTFLISLTFWILTGTIGFVASYIFVRKIYSAMSRIAAGFIIFRRFERNPIEYLLLQTSYGEHHWTPPKGHLDNDETPIEAAERETKEEAGLNREDFDICQGFEEKITYQVNGKSKDVFYYLARLINNEQKILLSNEHENFRWLNLHDACQLVKYIDMQNVLRKADEYLSQTNLSN